MKKSFKNVKNTFDVNKKGGAPFLGCKKLVLKCHGSSKRESVKATILQAAKLHENGLIDKIEKLVGETSSNLEVKND